MKSGNWKIVPALSALALATMFAPYAHAGCGLNTPVRRPASWQPRPQIASPRLVLAAFAIDEEAATPHEPSMVGTWKEKWISEGSSLLPDGAEFDASYSQWHSDGTEINVSGLRAPLTGDVCLGEWVKTGARTYQMNHFGISYDSTGVNLVGPKKPTIRPWPLRRRRPLAGFHQPPKRLGRHANAFRGGLEAQQFAAHVRRPA